MTSCDFVLPERSGHFNIVEMPFIYNACDRGGGGQMMLGVRGRRVFSPDEINECVWPHYGKKTLCPAAWARPQPRKRLGPKWTASEMNCWQQETAAQQAKQSNKHQVSVATVYLLTGPMLLGTPAGEKQRERRFNVRPQVTVVASAFENVWAGHVACTVLRRRSEGLRGALLSRLYFLL